MKNKHRFYGKKAVSPLIATVLLMAFAVALGAIVMTWGKEYVEETAEEVGTKSLVARTCALDVNIEIMRIAGVTTLCKGTSGTENMIQFIASNKGSEINGLQVVLIDINNEVFTNESVLSSPLSQAGARKVVVKYDPALLDDISQISITPKIKTNGQETFCTSRSIEEDLINQCS